MIDLNTLDYSDSKELFNFAKENVGLAEEYRRSRSRYGSAKRFLNIKLAEGYKNGTIDTKMAQEKAIMLLTQDDYKCTIAYEAVVKEEEAYKGMEQVIKAREHVVSLAQSLCKISPKQ